LPAVLQRKVVVDVGRNENAQLGQGDTVRRDVPTLIDSLSGLNIIRVACGKAHTVFLTSMLFTYLWIYILFSLVYDRLTKLHRFQV